MTRLDPRIKIKIKKNKKQSLFSKKQKGKHQNDDYTKLNHAKTNVSYPPDTHTCAYQGIRNVRKFGALCFLKAIVLIFLFISDLKTCHRSIANIKGSVTQLLKKQLNYCVNQNSEP